MNKFITTTLIAAGIALAAYSAAAAEIKIALDSPPDLNSSGSYVWANSFSKACFWSLSTSWGETLIISAAIEEFITLLERILTVNRV